MSSGVPIFDGHNDTLLRLVTSCPDPVAAFRRGGGEGHLDLELARQGGFAGGLFACFVRPDGERDAGFSLTEDGYNVVMPDPPGIGDARRMTDSMIACAHQLASELPNDVRLCRTAVDIRRSMADGVLSLTLHLEGAEAIDGDLDGLAGYFDAGVRSIGPVWSRPNRFGTGVPFRYPGSPDIGPGLTEAGFALVSACDELGVMLDVSHLNAAGFWDLARASRASLVATPLEIVLRHLDHLLDCLGPNGVAIGSDFDGAVMPADIRNAGGLPTLVARMAAHGYDESLLRKLCHANWINVLERCWH